MKIGRGVSELWGVENRPLPLTWPMAYTTACTTVQAVIIIRNYIFDARHAVDGTGDNDWEKQRRTNICSRDAEGRRVQLCDHRPGNSLSQGTFLRIWWQPAISERSLHFYTLYSLHFVFSCINFAMWKCEHNWWWSKNVHCLHHRWLESIKRIRTSKAGVLCFWHVILSIVIVRSQTQTVVYSSSSSSVDRWTQVVDLYVQSVVYHLEYRTIRIQ